MEIASKGQLRLAYLRWAVVTVPLILLLGFASSSLAPSGSENLWYARLAKPASTPPDWAFPVAWTLIYILMGLALAMILHARGARLRGLALALFAVQLVLNLLWTPLFFGMHEVVWSLVLIATLLVLVIATTFVFGRIRTAAAWLLVPYMVWISFAGIVLWEIHQLNPNAETLVPSAATDQIQLD